LLHRRPPLISVADHHGSNRTHNNLSRAGFSAICRGRTPYSRAASVEFPFFHSSKEEELGGDVMSTPELHQSQRGDSEAMETEHDKKPTYSQWHCALPNWDTHWTSPGVT
jgi:hypothetical protein